MEIRETYFQIWHRLSVTSSRVKSGFVFVLTPTVLLQAEGCGSLEAVPPSGAHPASFGDNMSSELANRLDIIL